MEDQFGFSFAGPPDPPVRVPLFRLGREIGPGVVERLYTASAQERDEATARYGYSPEGIACAIYDRPVPGAVPLIRLWHGPSRRHSFTARPATLAAALERGTYRNEGVTGFVFEAKGEPGTVPLHALVHRASNVHWYTTDATERDAAVAAGAEVIGVACWVYPPDAAGQHAGHPR